MVTYRWNNEKNKILKQNRGVTFEQAIMHIENGDVLDIIGHPNKTKYPAQQVLVININQYAYAVPFVQQGQERLLKTIVPSHKLTKLYLR
jgi:uncharacterized DUF497 family protein